MASSEGQESGEDETKLKDDGNVSEEFDENEENSMYKSFELIL